VELLRAFVRRSGIALVMIWLGLFGALQAEQRTTTAEDDIKAAFLFNFTQFVEWPAAGAAADPFRICVVADPAFGAAVDRTVAGESIDHRPIVRLTPATADAARECQILFIGRQENDRVDRWLSAVKGLHVLIVAESRVAWDHGAHINFVLENNRVKFDVNRDEAARAGLSISSKLLRVARNVTSRREE
jgi:hypothetical protein